MLLAELGCDESYVPAIAELHESYFSSGITKLAVRVGSSLSDVFVCPRGFVGKDAAVVAFVSDRVMYAYGIRAYVFLVEVFINGADGAHVLKEASDTIITYMIESLRNVELDSTGKELYERLIKYKLFFV